MCTTELGEMARLEPEFTKRGVKLLGLSANTVDSHEGWAADIKEISGNTLNFPIVADKERKVAFLYDMYVVFPSHVLPPLRGRLTKRQA